MGALHGASVSGGPDSSSGKRTQCELLTTESSLKPHFFRGFEVVSPSNPFHQTAWTVHPSDSHASDPQCWGSMWLMGIHVQTLTLIWHALFPLSQLPSPVVSILTSACMLNGFELFPRHSIQAEL